MFSKSSIVSLDHSNKGGIFTELTPQRALCSLSSGLNLHLDMFYVLSATTPYMLALNNVSGLKFQHLGG